jgi:hypothetical protein
MNFGYNGFYSTYKIILLEITIAHPFNLNFKLAPQVLVQIKFIIILVSKLTK